MKQQVFVIHGGDAFATYEEYLSYLQQKEVENPNSTPGVELGFQDWKSDLGEALGEDFAVICPRMPNAQNAKYMEWKIWFEKFIPFLRDEVIFVGHSLGGIFLAKYLAEEQFPLKIRATFLVAAPYNIHPVRSKASNGTGLKENSLGDFVLPAGELKKVIQQSGKIFLYHSQDDEVVPFSDVERYKKVLPNATVRAFTDRQHFNEADLPEIVVDLQNL